MRILFVLEDSDIVEFDVEELVNGFEDSFDRKIILEFHCDFLVYQCFEEGVEYCMSVGLQRERTYTFGLGVVMLVVVILK